MSGRSCLACKKPFGESPGFLVPVSDEAAVAAVCVPCGKDLPVDAVGAHVAEMLSGWPPEPRADPKAPRPSRLDRAHAALSVWALEGRPGEDPLETDQRLRAKRALEDEKRPPGREA